MQMRSHAYSFTLMSFSLNFECSSHIFAFCLYSSLNLKVFRALPGTFPMSCPPAHLTSLWLLTHLPRPVLDASVEHGQE